MLKLTCLVFLVAVAISWSQVDAGISPRDAPWKREVSSAEFKNELAAEVKDVRDKEFAKELLTSRLLISVLGNEREFDELDAAFKRAVKENYDSMDAFIAEIVRIYEEVTGRKPNADDN